MKPVCVQLNWARQIGGGEVYTRFFSAALNRLGWDVRLVVDPKADFWESMNLESVKLIPASGKELLAVLPRNSVIVGHMLPDPETSEAIARNHRFGGVVHMPMHDRQPPRALHYCDKVFGVSAYVCRTIAGHGFLNVYAEPLLGVGDLLPRVSSTPSIVRASEYQWDRRKYREKVLSFVERLRPKAVAAAYERRKGLTLAIVSRLTPIKQFPQLFSYLTPIIAEFPEISLEIFGSGGYASVRDLRKQLKPLGDRVRWWGQQSDPSLIYPQVDYVMSGLPEKEALGLNLIESQVAGTPVLAIDSPPFTETVADGVSGVLYPDPRRDEGSGFRELLRKIIDGNVHLNWSESSAHLERFTERAFTERVGRAMLALSSNDQTTV